MYGLGVSGASGVVRAQIAEMQRARLLAAATGVVSEIGYVRATVAHITSRARVSRRTFYELFDGREECLVAVLDDAVARVGGELRAAVGVGRGSWLARLRAGVWVLLCFLERDAALARVCVVESLRGGPAMAQRRGEILALLAGLLDEGRPAGTRGATLPALTAEGLVSASVGILHSRMLSRRYGALTELYGELMAMLTLPYLGSGAARREQTRGAPGPPPAREQAFAGDPLEGVAMRITYRTARVLEGIAAHPGASNRQVAFHAGIQDQGQVSKLLGRLQRLGLLSNHGEGRLKGEANAWVLTPRGQQVTRTINLRALHGTRQQPAGARAPADIDVSDKRLPRAAQTEKDRQRCSE